MLESMINPPPPIWDYPPNIVARITKEAISDRIDLVTFGGQFQLRYSVNGPVIGTTSNVSWFQTFNIPANVSEVFFSPVVADTVYNELRFTGASVTGLYWSPKLKVGAMMAANNPKLQAVSKYLPDGIYRLGSFFSGDKIFNYDISEWDTSNITNMGSMFSAATSFNQDLSGWDVSKVTDRRNYDTNTPAWLPSYKPKFK